MREADDHDADHRLGREARRQPQQAGELLQRQLRRRRTTATGSGSRTPCNGIAQRPAIVGNNPHDANVAEQLHAAGRLGHASRQPFGLAGDGGDRYYILDNEHSIWHSTHRDVRPTGATMDEVRDTMVDYSSAIKHVDPGALVVGPEEWGWSGYFFSGYDQQYGSQHGWSFLPDRAAHGGKDYLPLAARRSSSCDPTSTSGSVLDVFTVHYYPQGGEFWPTTTSARAMQLRRNRSTRSLWDPNYIDETWINDRVQLIPRLRSLGRTPTTTPARRSASPNTTGAPKNHINGATTQADIYGIFGREGLDIGARWTTPAATTPTYKAMKMYRNYDGNRSAFGDTSVRATSTANADNLSVFAARARERRRAHGDGDREGAVRLDAGHDQPLELHPGRRRAGLAADVGERHHPAGRCGVDRARA